MLFYVFRVLYYRDKLTVGRVAYDRVKRACQTVHDSQSIINMGNQYTYIYYSRHCSIFFFLAGMAVLYFYRPAPIRAGGICYLTALDIHESDILRAFRRQNCCKTGLLYSENPDDSD